jgi:hypothetical protein
MMAHWYSPFWNPETSKNVLGATQSCARETHANPPANELGLGVPTACQVRSAVVLQKKEEKKVRPKYLLV